MTACLMCPSCAAAHANARRSADAAVQCAGELGTVAAQEVAARDALALLAAEYRAAVIAERAAETAHTNAGPGARQPAMRAMLAARGVRTTAEARLGAALDGGR